MVNETVTDAAGDGDLELRWQGHGPVHIVESNDLHQVLERRRCASLHPRMTWQPRTHTHTRTKNGLTKMALHSIMAPLPKVFKPMVYLLDA